jgi:Ni2+-binding GTPase involved in maturation of urease and hydrogenase
VGTGKASILNKLRERFRNDYFTIAVLKNPIQTSDTTKMF